MEFPDYKGKKCQRCNINDATLMNLFDDRSFFLCPKCPPSIPREYNIRCYICKNHFRDDKGFQYTIFLRSHNEEPRKYACFYCGNSCLKSHNERINKEESYTFINEGMPCRICKKNATKKCGKCKETFYCSLDCQKKDWPDHKTICCLPSENKL